ncbi:protein of unknown function (plasmid) [Vibrio harveyi]|nr:protein of unknown function [Vibrio harveyi]CAH1586650.1 protein of unknown function [Vibrio harveyi]CAH1592442.1 protein of unknown function [Vibrio harveyi]
MLYSIYQTFIKSRVVILFYHQCDIALLTRLALVIFAKADYSQPLCFLTKLVSNALLEKFLDVPNLDQGNNLKLY